MLVWVAMLAQTDDWIARARRTLSVEPHCAAAPAGGDVIVCGRRRADRFRVPFVVHDPGDPSHEGVPAERARLLAHTSPLQERGPFLTGGGMAGVHATVGGSGTKVGGLRPLAP